MHHQSALTNRLDLLPGELIAHIADAALSVSDAKHIFQAYYGAAWAVQSYERKWLVDKLDQNMIRVHARLPDPKARFTVRLESGRALQAIGLPYATPEAAAAAFARQAPHSPSALSRGLRDALLTHATQPPLWQEIRRTLTLGNLLYCVPAQIALRFVYGGARVVVHTASVAACQTGYVAGTVAAWAEASPFLTGRDHLYLGRKVVLGSATCIALLAACIILVTVGAVGLGVCTRISDLRHQGVSALTPAALRGGIILGVYMLQAHANGRLPYKAFIAMASTRHAEGAHAAVKDAHRTIAANLTKD